MVYNTGWEELVRQYVFFNGRLIINALSIRAKRFDPYFARWIHVTCVTFPSVDIFSAIVNRSKCHITCCWYWCPLRNIYNKSFRELGHHWFRKCLISRATPNQCLHQSWPIISSVLAYKLQWYLSRWTEKVLENDVNSATVWFANNYMCVNTDKFQSIILNRDGKHTLSISVQDNTVLSDTSITVLGVVLDDKLKFDEHVSVLCSKVSRQINALNRVSKYLDEKCRIMVYKSFISSNFNYCPVAWMFCGKKNLVKL